MLVEKLHSDLRTCVYKLKYRLYVKVSLYAVSQNNCKDLKIEQTHVYSNNIDYIENLF